MVNKVDSAMSSPLFVFIMRRTVATSKLTKDFIESKVSQELIMSKYLDIPLETIIDCVNTNKLIPSIFRDDGKKPSMGFTFNKKGRLKVRDFGGTGTFFDVYDAVAYVLSHAYERKIEPNNKQDFYFILKHIANTFSNIIDNKEVDENIDPIIQEGLRKGKQHKAIIEIVPRSWNKEDKAIWNKWGINLNYLNTHFVIPVEQYYIDRGVNSDPKYYYRSKDPCYAYMLGQDRRGVYLIKLYFPLRNRATELKFITNCNILEGIYNLELDNYDYILITKSSKDRLSIGNHIASNPLYRGGKLLNIGIINLPMWFVYARNDNTVVPSVYEEPLLQRLKQLGAGQDLHVSEFADVHDTSGLYYKDSEPYPYYGHFSWIYFFNNECFDGDLSLWQWLSEQKLD